MLLCSVPVLSQYAANVFRITLIGTKMSKNVYIGISKNVF